MSAAAEYVAPDTGHFLPNNPGKPKGARDLKPRAKRKQAVTPEMRKELAQTALERVAAAGNQHVEALVQSLVTEAQNGNVQAAATLLRHLAPPSPRSVVRDQADLALLPPEQRLAEISARVAAGHLPIEHAVALQSLATAEIEAQWLTPLKSLLRDLRSGSIGLEVLARRLIDLADAVEAEPVSANPERQPPESPADDDGVQGPTPEVTPA